MSALTRTSPTPDGWEQLASAVVDTQQQTQETYVEAEQAHMQLREMAQATIQNLRSAIEVKRSAIAATKMKREGNPIVNALEAKLAELAKTRDKLAQTMANMQTEISTMQQSSAELQKANDDLINNPAQQEKAYNAWWKIMTDRWRAEGIL